MKKIIMTIGLGCLTFGLYSCERSTTEATSDPARPLVTYQVTSESSRTVRTFTGAAKSVQEATLAFEVSGKLEVFDVSVGDEVKKGEVLARLNDRGFENSYRERLAQVERTEDRFQRMKKAVVSGAVSKQAFTNAKTDYDAAVASLDNAKKSLEDSVLLAPFDGVVVSKFRKNYTNVVAKERIIKLINPESFEMVTDIPENLIHLARKGMSVEIEFDALPGIIVPGEISEVAAESSSVTRTYPVTLQMEQLKREDNKLILSGMTGTAWLKNNVLDKQSVRERVGFNVPVTSVYANENDEEFVWVVNSDVSTVSKRAIETIELSGSGVLVRGLEGDEVIARSGVNHLQEGQKVKILTH